ncbi:MAG: hypothetical protein FWE45_05390 [Firmicutes bacterium]|nr:hypothetical protein [Bacillota bacterium]
MKTVLTLIKLQFKARVALPKKKGVRYYTKLAFALAALLGLFSMFVFIYYLLAGEFMHIDERFDLRREFLIFTLLGFQILQTIFLVPALVKTLDINNERELLLKLPLSHRQIFASKIIVSYIYEILFATVIMLPLLIAYGFASEMHWGFFAYIPIILIFIPAIPFFIATLFVYPITKIVNMMRTRALLTSLAYLVGLVGAVILYMHLIDSTMLAILDSGSFREELNYSAPDIRHTARYFFPQALFANLIDTRWYTALWSFFAMFGISAALFTISYFIAGANYKKTYMDERANFSTLGRKSAFKPRHPLYATTKKDALNIFRSSNYTFQFLLIVIITPIIVFYTNRIAMFSGWQSFKNTGEALMAEDLVFGVSMFVMLILLPLSSSFAASNITREGWNIYHTKLIPQSFIRQLMVKTLMVFIPILLSIVTTILLMRIPYQPDFMAPPQYVAWADAAYLFGVAVLMTIGYIALGTYLDLRNPLCNQVGSGELTKSTSHVNMIMMSGLLIGATVGILLIFGAYADVFVNINWFFFTLAWLGTFVKWAFFGFATLFAIAACLLLFLHGPKRYRTLEQ